MAGNNSKDWQISKLEDICDQITDGKHGDCQDESDSGFYFLSCKDVLNGQLNYKNARQITESDFLDTHRRTKFAPSDILITNSGTIGRMAIAPDNGLTLRTTFQKSVAILKPIVSRAEPKFLYYAVQSDIRRLIEFAGGTAQKNLLLRDLRAFEVRLPSLSLQRRISGILAAYDVLMETNSRRIEVLEEMARTLYREWFVHFRFPGHEKLKRVDSALGPIPQGWEVKKLRDLIAYNRSSTKRGPHLRDRRYVPIDCLPTKSLALLEAKPIEEAQSSLQLFEKGDILFGAMRPYFHKVVVAPFDGVTRTTCFVFKPVCLEWSAFAVMTAFEETTVAYANAHSQGATIPYAVWEGSFSEMPLTLPPHDLLRRFGTIVAPMIASISQSFFRLNNLRRTRDLLLPRLLSGQVSLEAD
jgi:type I restriction enzyme S subunit